MSDSNIYKILSDHVLSAYQLIQLGFPIECNLGPGKAIFFADTYPDKSNKDRNPLMVNNASDLLENKNERVCVRCKLTFYMDDNGDYMDYQDPCIYHYGKLFQNRGNNLEYTYTCCNGNSNHSGCTFGLRHVWTGINKGFNGPLDGYVRTGPRKTIPTDGNFGIYAVDCEMSFTANGLEVTKITVVGSDGRLVYDTLVKPDKEIVCYNTRFSGITPQHFYKFGYKSLKEVQNDLIQFINSDTILIGHGLENDLRALKMIHPKIIDTSILFPHEYGLPYRRSLKSLSKFLLKKDIHTSPTGHDSIEDARSSLELALFFINLKRNQSIP